MISKKQKTLKGSMLAVLLLLMPTMLYAACTGSSPTWTTTPDYASVSACVAKATSGDTINVSAGSVTWDHQLVITKGINLIGPGANLLTINGNYTAPRPSTYYLTENGLIAYVPTAPENREPFRLSGFTINANNMAHAILLVNNSAFTNATVPNQVRIDHNIIESGTSMQPIVVKAMWGVIDNNTFNHSRSLTIVGTNSSAEWDSDMCPIVYGLSRYMHIEDNTFNMDNNMCAISHSYGGRSVMRYNQFNTASVNPNTIVDMHNMDPLYYGTMGTEMYGNKVTATTSATVLYYGQRGGKGLFFNNYINSTPSFAQLKVRQEDPLSTCLTHNCSTKDGGQTGLVEDSYYFNNWHGSSRIELSSTDFAFVSTFQTAPYTGLPVEIEENTNFFRYNANCTVSACSSGVGIGSGAPTGTCTTGVGYWKTNQSSDNILDHVGINPSTPISGTLYKCTATNKWEPYYTPYTYPHPLRNSTVSYTDNTQEPAPTTSVPPTIAVSPTMKDFGTLPINTSSPAQRFTVTTTGGNLNVDAISMTGTDATQFAIQNDSCTGKIIAPEIGSCTFDVKFSPLSVGTKAANVAIVDNDSNTSKLIAVNGTGTSQIPAISFSPTSLFFSNVLSGTLSSPQTIRVSNTSTNFVTISSISLSGTYANQFSIPAATDYCTGETVAASGNCSFQVIFAPTSGGEKTANVNLTALYYSSPATLPLYGSAVVYPAPKIKISRTK